MIQCRARMRLRPVKKGNLFKMRSDRYKENSIDQNSPEEYSASVSEDVSEKTKEPEPPLKTKSLFGKKDKSDAEAEDQEPDLSRMKKKDLLEIMLAQSKEIDSLRARVDELETQLANREFEFSKIGSIAEASLAVTNIFKEAEEAAKIYLENIRRSYERQNREHSND